MTVEDVKKTIEQRTGVPISVLTGETVDDVIESARAILEYRREQEQHRPKNTREQFAEWARDQYGETIPDAESAALDKIAEAVRVDNGGYPRVRDGGQIDISNMPDPRPTAVQFEEWFRKKTAFDPLKSHSEEMRL